MKRHLTFCLMLALNSFSVTLASAQSASPSDVTETLPLEKALRELLAKGPRIVRTRTNIEVASAQKVGATVWPNPWITYGGLYLATGSNTGAALGHQIMASQPLLIFGQTSARKKVAERGIDVAEARVRSDIADAIRDTRLTFTALLSAQTRVELLSTFAKDIQRIENIVHGRETAGESSSYDTLRLRLERQALETRIQVARVAVTDASGKMAILLGREGTSIRADGTLETESSLSGNKEIWWDRAQKTRPVLVLARSHIAAADSLILQAKRDKLPVPILSLGIEITQNQNSVSPAVGLAMPIPIFDWGQGQIANARAQTKSFTDIYLVTEIEARAELFRAADVLKERRRATQEFGDTIEPQLPTLRAMSENAYRSGQKPVLDLLDALRTERDLRLIRIDLLEAAKNGEIDLLYAAGL